MFGFHEITPKCHMSIIRISQSYLFQQCTILCVQQLMLFLMRKTKPEIVTLYNHKKGMVNTLDKTRAWFSCKRAEFRWPVILRFEYNIMTLCYHEYNRRECLCCIIVIIMLQHNITILHVTSIRLHKHECKIDFTSITSVLNSKNI